MTQSLVDKPPAWLHWLDPEWHEQHAWAAQYLRDKIGDALPGGPRCYADLLEITSTWPDNRETRKFFTRMRNAWRQKKHRLNRTECGKQACPLVMSRRAVKKLDQLAKQSKRSRSETAEQLIQDLEVLVNQMRERYKKGSERSEREVSSLKRAVSDLVDVLDELAVRVCRAEMKLEQIDASPLTFTEDPDCEARARQLVSDRLNRIPEVRLMRLDMRRLRSKG